MINITKKTLDFSPIFIETKVLVQKCSQILANRIKTFTEDLTTVCLPISELKWIVLGIITSVVLKVFGRPKPSLFPKQEKLKQMYQSLVERSQRLPNAALILKPPIDQDHNGAIEDLDYCKIVNYSLLSNRFAIIEKRVSTTSEINSEIRELRKLKRIGLLWITAHGNRKGILLGHFMTQKEVSQIQFSLLEPGATILLHSCRVGEPTETVTLAERVKWAAGPFYKVIAPTSSCASCLVILDSRSNLQFKMCDATDNDITIQPKEEIIQPKIVKELSSVTYYQILSGIIRSIFLQR